MRFGQLFHLCYHHGIMRVFRCERADALRSADIGRSTIAIVGSGRRCKRAVREHELIPIAKRRQILDHVKATTLNTM